MWRAAVDPHIAAWPYQIAAGGAAGFAFSLLILLLAVLAPDGADDEVAFAALAGFVFSAMMAVGWFAIAWCSGTGVAAGLGSLAWPAAMAFAVVNGRTFEAAHANGVAVALALVAMAFGLVVTRGVGIMRVFAALALVASAGELLSLLSAVHVDRGLDMTLITCALGGIALASAASAFMRSGHARA